ncbi:MAG: ABC transporter permease [Defluviitaleaceae bacterium]|nr:ABC transporter permease [Defluviitaleaceae bacterium]
MFIIKNSLHNLLRNKGRNILLAVIIFTIIATTAVTLIINNTANGIIEDYKHRFGSRVNIVPDTAQIMENLRSSFGGGGLGGIFGGGGMGGLNRVNMGNIQVTAQQSIAFAQSPYVLTYEMTASQPAFSDTLNTVDGDADLELGGGMFGGRGGGMGDMFGGAMGGITGINPDEMDIPNLRLYGNHWEDFQNGLRDVADGRFPIAYGEAMISLELAELNDLMIGDTIRIYSTLTEGSGEDITSRRVVHDLTVVGIYFDMTPENATGGFIRASFLNRRNEVLTTLDTVISPLGANESGITVNAVYYLHEPDMLPLFEAELRNQGLDPLLLVTTNEAEYLAIVEPVVGLRNVTSTFMIIVLVLGGIVLVVLASISVRERKYEIGVLRAMGMKKKKLVLGLLSEMLALTVICLVLGLTVGSLVAQPISDTLLAVQIENITPEEVAEIGGMGGLGGLFGGMGGARGGMGGMFGGMAGGNTIEAEPLSELNVSLGLMTILEIIGISLLLASLAGVASVARITKYEPMKILMERN